ncbi:hypothetical protein ACRE_037510 [Hapsidospora chrysogenum ATCC 11550]|uniref:HD domain-containing protein n=1 Tax=Hapsidospora chrysogenum (strain ATCC 11550 / CBS 779.69 / DSM 880 / IAM 14645 / JCM 23072 / IMI 49137) TaxID=857340 RepID=A0A086T7T2_HAPC1|nr:hypothetical protein ACRE_037510 [Hapsidospora chrysogenum ATCC 11550]
MADKKRSPIPGYVLERIPQDAVCTSTLEMAQDALSEPILNHSLRVFLIAKWLAERESSEWAKEDKLPLLFVATACHDFGASDLYNGKQRFEVEGADAAKAHLLSHGASPEESHQAWTAIALHTSPGIAERIDPLSRLVRLAVKSDFSPSFRAEVDTVNICAEIECHLPRLEVEKALGDAVVKQAAKIPDKVDSLTWPNTEKHPSAGWPGILLRAHLENPGYEGINPAF